MSYFKEFQKDQFLVLRCLTFTSMIYFFALNEIDICNFSDDKTPYVCGSKLKSVLEKQDHNFEIAIAWFEMNCVKLKLTNVIC